MCTFFNFYTNIDKSLVFKNLGFEHIASIIVIFSFIYVFLKHIKKSHKRTQTIVIRACALLVPVLELSHNVWLSICGNADWTQLLSLHLCGMQMYFIPLAVFTKPIVFKDFIFATSILGGIFGIIFPSGIANAYPLWHFQTLQTFFYHALLIIVPVAILITTDYRPTIKRFHKVLAIFLFIIFIALLVDLKFNENYLFLVTAPDVPLLQGIQAYAGTIPYLLFTFFILLITCVCIHLPFDLKHSKKNAY